MPLSIKDPETDRLARDLARETGETITVATRKALQERLLRERGRKRTKGRKERLVEISFHCASLPDLDMRSADEILGYDEHGLPR
ncbi:MAG: type II toxin-antitoxin system VapB family antitoxin [Dongiaceae bacterium]